MCTWSQCLISSFASEPGDGRQSAVACPSSSNRLRLSGGQRWRRRRQSSASRWLALWVSRAPLFSTRVDVCVCVHNIIYYYALCSSNIQLVVKNRSWIIQKIHSGQIPNYNIVLCTSIKYSVLPLTSPGIVQPTRIDEFFRQTQIMCKSWIINAQACWHIVRG